MRVADQKARCPVRPGDIWRAGNHLFGCGDLADGDTLDRLLALADPITLAYGDPPWNDGDTKRYRTLAAADVRIGPNPGWRTTFTAALTPAQTRQLLMYVEISRRSYDSAGTLAEEMGAVVHGPWPVHYRPGVTESLMFAADWRPLGGPLADIVDPDAASAPIQALAGHEPGVVLDPCCGNGWTVRAGHMLGWSVVAHELTPRRLWMAMRRQPSSPERVS